MAGSDALMHALKTTVDSHNVSFLDAARSAGYVQGDEDLNSVLLKKGSYSAFIELHIEQGPILEEEGSFLILIFIISFRNLSCICTYLVCACLSRHTCWYSNCNCSPCKHKGRF